MRQGRYRLLLFVANNYVGTERVLFCRAEKVADLWHLLSREHAKRLFLLEIPEKVNLEGRQEVGEMGSMHQRKLLCRK